MKSLHVITKLVVGGAQESLLTTLAAFTKPDHEFHVASAPGGEWEQRARDLGAPVLLLPTLLNSLRTPAADMRAVRQLAAYMKRNRFDVVHTRSSKAGIIGRAAARLANVPVVVHHIHGLALNDRGFARWEHGAIRMIERTAARHTDHLIAVSDAIRRQLLATRIASPDRVHVLYDPVDLRRFENVPDKLQARARLGLPGNAKVVGTVGRISACNAPQQIAEIAARLAAHDPSVFFLVVGHGEDMPILERAAETNPNLHLLGFRDDVPEILAALDVYVGTSLWGGLPRSLVEAMLLATPVVAYPVAGIPEVLERDVTGLHAGTGNAADAAARITQLLEDPAAANAMAANARAKVLPLVDPHAQARTLESIYEDTLRKRSVLCSAS